MLTPNRNRNQIVVIILTLNQRERTLQCLSSIKQRGGRSSRHILLWDNGSSDGTAKAVKEAFPEVLVYSSPSNLGVASGRNAAAELAIKTFDPTHLLFLDNDMLAEQDFVDALAAPFSKGAKIGQTQAKLMFMHDRERLNDGGGARINFILWKVKPVGFGEIERGQYDTPKKCISCGGAMMVRTDVFQKLGGFDPVFDPFGPEDLDFSLRLQKAGYIALYVPGAVAYHAVSHTFGSEYSEIYAKHKFRHWLLFMRRHASMSQKIGFITIGAPYLAAKVLIREGSKGNFGVFKGFVRGARDFLLSSKTPERRD